jgi:natural product biosynthesis luciferase-like monooxygenase protein
MKFDLFFTCESAERNPGRAYADIIAQAVRAEELGFGAVWIAEHHGSTYGMAPSPAVMLGAISQRTSRIRLASGVSVLPFRHPVLTAEEYAMVDVLSGGRLIFGAGRGYQPQEFNAFGIDPATSRERFEESIEIIRGLWENETFSYSGQHFQVDNVSVTPRPIQNPVPVWMAASSKASFAYAAENRIGIITQPSLRQSVQALRANMSDAVSAFVANGTPAAEVDIPVNVIVHIAEKSQTARDEAEGPLTWHFDRVRALAPGSDGKPIAKGYESYKSYGDSRSAANGADAVTIDTLNQARVALIGDPDDAVEYIKAMQAEIGLEHMTCFMRFGGIDHDAVMRSLELWATEVMPEFREAA